jgi:hypothetical protein
MRGQGLFVAVVLGIIAVVVAGYFLFWGTVGVVAYHFIHKLW